MVVVNGRRIIFAVVVVLALVLAAAALGRIFDAAQQGKISQGASNQVAAVSKNTGQADSFFAEQRLNRERSRSRQIELLERIVNNDKAEAKSRSRAAQRLVQISELMEQERVAEQMIRAMGYADCVVLMEGGGILAVVSDTISQEQSTEIKSRLSEFLGYKKENVYVTSRPLKKAGGGEE